MVLGKENTGLSGRILMIFGQFACQKRCLPDFHEGKWRLNLDPEDTGLKAERELVLICERGRWRMGEKALDENHPIYFYTENHEKFLILLSERIGALKPADRIHLEKEDKISIGSAFRNQIFYDCFSLIESVHAEISMNQQECVVRATGTTGVYVNGKALETEAVLHPGDRVNLYGLQILALKDMLVCASFCGVKRVAKRAFRERKGTERNITEDIHQDVSEYNVCREERIKDSEAKEAAKGDAQGQWIERRCMQEEKLHTGEVEILLPVQSVPQRSQPLILTAGPALTMVLPMLLMAELGSKYMGNTGGSFYYLSAAMSGCSALLTLFWGVTGEAIRRHSNRREQKEKGKQYREYLEGLSRELTSCQEENRAILAGKYPPLAFFCGGEGRKPMVLWNRYYRQKDFLFLRLGLGQIPFQITVRTDRSQKGIVQRKAAAQAQELAERFRYIDDVPVGVDLYQNRQIGMIEGTDREGTCELLLCLLTQIMICHCYTEVKVVCFYRKERTLDRKIAACLRWMPHCWSPDRGTRFLAGNEKEAGEILPVLTRALTENREENAAEDKRICIPWYIVLVLEEELILGEPFYRYLTRTGEKDPVSSIFVQKEREMLPKGCRYFMKRTGEKGEMLSLGEDTVERRAFMPESCSFPAAWQYIRQMSGCRVKDTESDKVFPDKVAFLKLYGCRRVEELGSGTRWRHSAAGERLKVPVGMRAGGQIVNLDVHEKFHGPHGLVAGTTGSGKSELLQTYLISMAVSFSPEEVNFFMIDYKGGGTGNLLKDLPHCAGVISNLSGRQIKRAMSAITSENKRRQELLGRFQVNHIDGYTRLYREGKASQAMPHLLLVVDEFAELKKEEPEFMQEIISLAQVGRSLGVHLILATQKPAGTVDDKIWSNARFRLCLRVQDRQDSMDMLHNTDAALLTSPGQCYMQIGNNEYYERFQSGYCGERYSEGGEKKAGAVLVSETGKRLKKEEKDSGERGRSQLEVLVDYLKETAEKNGYEKAPSLWLPELPELLFLEELRNEYRKARAADQEKVPPGKEWPEILLGLCDDPGNQCRSILAYNPVFQGHLAVCGGPASGKTSLLQTLLWQLCEEYTPQEVQILVVDMGQESLGCFGTMPHCLGVLKRKKDRDIFFFHLEEVMDRRRKQLSGISCEQYNRSGKGRLPLLFLVVDNLGNLRKQLEEKQEELVMKLASQGLTLGIYLILSASGISEMGGKLHEKIKTCLALEMSDRFQYGDILRQYYLPVFPEENRKGRGLCKVDGRILEFQTALTAKEQGDYVYIERIQEEGKRKEETIRAEKGFLPEKFPVIPERVWYEDMADKYNWSGNSLPLGYDLSNGKLCGLSVNTPCCFLISGSERTGRTTLLSCMIESAVRVTGWAMVIDLSRRMEHFRGRKGILYLGNEKELDNWRQKSVYNKDTTKSGREETETKRQKIPVFISNLVVFCSYLYRDGAEREEKAEFWEQEAAGNGRAGFLAGVYHPGKDYEISGREFFREFAAWQQGIHLGGNAVAQRILDFSDLGYAQQNQQEGPGIGYWKEGPGSVTKRLLLPDYQKRDRCGKDPEDECEN